MPEKKTAASKGGTKKRTTKSSQKKVTGLKRATKNVPAKKSPATTKKRATKTQKKVKGTEKVTIKNRVTKEPSVLHTLNKELNRTPKPVKQRQTKALALRNRLHIAILSPYRLPIDMERLAVQSARIAGLAFVLVGAFFTATHVSVMSDQLVQSSSLRAEVSSTRIFDEINFDNDADAESELLEPLPAEPVYERPSVSLNPDVRPSENQINIKVRVEKATDVSLSAVHTSSGKTITLGTAKKISSDTWAVEWDTTSVVEGEYALFAVVANEVEKYTSERRNVTVKNEKITNSETVEETDEPAVDETDEQVESTRSDDGSESLSDIVESIVKTGAPSVVIKPATTQGIAKDLSISIYVSDDTSLVEVYAVPQLGVDARYLGRARKVNDNNWNYIWDTTQTPNGTFKLFATARVDGNNVKSTSVSVSIKNQFTNTVATTIATPDLVAESGVSTTTANESRENKENEEILRIGTVVEQVKIEEAQKYNTTSTESTLQKPALLNQYASDIDKELVRLTAALRSDDQNAIEFARKRFKELQETILNESADPDIDLNSLRVELEQNFSALEEQVNQTESIVRKRVGDAITKDSDNDGITDYDEVALYGSDPQNPDSDGDGFIDGAEILRGYNPNDASAEAVLSYESPKEAGVIREDILQVKSIRNVLESNTTEDSGKEAVITGTALPNSFVTLYIFSTPVVVTVKTDESGAWSYTFDKEIENGEHEVYVGVTDNAGKIVAKSEPLRFIKTAEAYTPVTSAAAGGAMVPLTDSDDGLLTEEMMLVLLSVSVMVLGLILIMLGVHLGHRKEHLVASPGLATT